MHFGNRPDYDFQEDSILRAGDVRFLKGIVFSKYHWPDHEYYNLLEYMLANEYVEEFQFIWTQAGLKFLNEETEDMLNLERTKLTDFWNENSGRPNCALKKVWKEYVEKRGGNQNLINAGDTLTSEDIDFLERIGFTRRYVNEQHELVEPDTQPTNRDYNMNLLCNMLEQGGLETVQRPRTAMQLNHNS